jgi:hypothetical protein
MRGHLLFVLTLASALAVSAAGCGPSEQPGQPPAPPAPPAPGAGATPSGATSGNLHVTSIVTGRSVHPDNTPADATELFLASDDVWATVVVEGTAPHATLQARWLTDSGGVLEQSSQEITPTGHTVVAFHIAARPGGWPLGRYKVEVLLDGVVVGTQDFEIRKPPF